MPAPAFQKMKNDMNGGFIVEFYDMKTGKPTVSFGSSHLGDQLPQVGDTIICPDSKRDFRSGDPAKHFAHEVTQRYLLPDVIDHSNEVRLVPPASPRAD